MTKINAERKLRGLNALPARSYLTTKAHQHSAAMARRGRLYHSNLSNICCYRMVAENVGVGGSVLSVHRALMASPGHRANILQRGWHGVGVGVVKRDGRLWVTQIFRQS